MSHFTLTDPMPPKRNRVRFPCGVCDKPCREDTVNCDDCNTWVHRNCLHLSAADFHELGKTDVPFFCARCIGQQDDGVWNWTTTLNR